MKKKPKSPKGKGQKKQEVELQSEPIMTTVVEKPKAVEAEKTDEIKQEVKSKPEENKKTVDNLGKFKPLALVLLFGILIYLVYYFLNFQNLQFFPGPEIDQESFKEVFASAQNIYIVMDVRNIKDPVSSNHVLQCGVDFAASSGMGGKTVVPLSFSDDGCIIPTGYIPPSNCSAMLKDGITIYVKAGNDKAKYYANGMVVSVGSNYTLGMCSINVVNLPVPVPQENSNSTEAS